MRLLFLHGANLNILGKRGKEYGDFTYQDLENTLDNYCINKGITPLFFISNHEGELIERLQGDDYDALIINLGAFSHTSLALCDTLLCINKPKIEVHITNIHAKNRHTSLSGSAVDGVITGLKMDGYFMAIDYFLKYE